MNIKCQGCEREQPKENFPVRKDRTNKLRPYCRTCANDINRARYSHHRKTKPFKHRAARAKTRAKSLNIPFDLDEKYLENLWTGVCPVLKKEIHLDGDRTDELVAELDRFTPELGYVKGNVIFLSRKANRIKNNSNIEILENLLEWMKTWK